MNEILRLDSPHDPVRKLTTPPFTSRHAASSLNGEELLNQCLAVTSESDKLNEEEEDNKDAGEEKTKMLAETAEEEDEEVAEDKNSAAAASRDHNFDTEAPSGVGCAFGGAVGSHFSVGVIEVVVSSVGGGGGGGDEGRGVGGDGVVVVGAGGGDGNGGGGRNVLPMRKISSGSNKQHGLQSSTVSSSFSSQPRHSCLPLLFERAASSWWHPQFDSEILEKQYWKSTLPRTTRKFQFGLSYLFILSFLLAIYFPSMKTRHWPTFLGT